jgi:hypothetical protein
MIPAMPGLMLLSNMHLAYQMHGEVRQKKRSLRFGVVLATAILPGSISGVHPTATRC